MQSGYQNFRTICSLSLAISIVNLIAILPSDKHSSSGSLRLVPGKPDIYQNNEFLSAYSKKIIAQNYYYLSR